MLPTLPKPHFHLYVWISACATLLALLVVVLGAYTRLSDAGLGCPDWPGCYGHLSVPQTPAQLAFVAHQFPGHQVEAPKAWKEMVHRYVAGTLGIVILALAVWGFFRIRRGEKQPLLVPIALTLLVVFQAGLGMWTVTLKVQPLIVSLHLIAGMSIVALLWLLTLLSADIPSADKTKSSCPTLGVFAWIGLLILSFQLFLGAWTSTNYAAMVCPDVPGCHGMLFPELHLKEAFQLFQPLGVNYEGGRLGVTARIGIQMMHRYGAFLTATYWSCLSLWMLFAPNVPRGRGVAAVILLFLIIQVSLGVLNVFWQLPMPIALAHNGVAVCLLLSVVTLLFKLRSSFP